MLKQYATRIYTYEEEIKGPCEWIGPIVWATSEQAAQVYLNDNGLGYCKVIGEYVCDTSDGVGVVGLGAVLS